MTSVDGIMAILRARHPGLTEAMCRALAAEALRIADLVATQQAAYNPNELRFGVIGGRNVPPLCKALRVLREQAGLTQQQVAQDTGWSQSKVTRVETGEVGISLTDLRYLLRLYNATPDVTEALLAYVRRPGKRS